VFSSASHWPLGRSARAIASAEDAFAISETADDESLSVGANFSLCCAHITTGHWRKAESSFETIAASLTGERQYERCGLPFVPAVISRSWLVWALAERGEFEQGQRDADEALQIAKDVGHPFNLAHIYYDMGYFYAVKGEFELVVDALSRGYDLIQEWNLSYLPPFITGFYGHACVLDGQVKYGTGLLKRAISEYASIGLGLFRSLVTMQVSEALLLRGWDREAWDTAEQALILAIRRGECGHEACVRRLLDDMALRDNTGDAATVKEHFRKALEAAVAFDLQPIEAHCHFGLSRVHGIEGDRPTSKVYLQRATSMYRQMGMSSWVERAQTSIGR
jgi:tetratricopeptide (TPR) repeat protein